MIVFADAIVDPLTVVVEVRNALVADVTVA